MIWTFSWLFDLIIHLPLPPHNPQSRNHHICICWILSHPSLTAQRGNQNQKAWILVYFTRWVLVGYGYGTVSLIWLSAELLQGIVLAPLLFTFYAADFKHNSANDRLQNHSDDSADVGLITNGDNRENRELTPSFVDWCQQKHPLISAGETK